MPSSPGVPTGGAPPAVVYARLWEHHPVKEVGAMGGDAQELSPRLPWDDNSEAKTLEHEEKVSKYQAMLTARLKAKYFFSKAFDKGGQLQVYLQIQQNFTKKRTYVHLWSLPPLPSAIVNLGIVEPRQNEQIIWLQETFGKVVTAHETYLMR